jgi:hypothetical protein
VPQRRKRSSVLPSAEKVRAGAAAAAAPAAAAAQQRRRHRAAAIPGGGPWGAARSAPPQPPRWLPPRKAAWPAAWQAEAGRGRHALPPGLGPPVVEAEPRPAAAPPARLPQGVTEEVWQELRSESGQVRSMMRLLQAAQAGGVERHLRPEVWPLLLGCFAPEDGYEVQVRVGRVCGVGGWVGGWVSWVCGSGGWVGGWAGAGAGSLLRWLGTAAGREDGRQAQAPAGCCRRCGLGASGGGGRGGGGGGWTLAPGPRGRRAARPPCQGPRLAPLPLPQARR